MMYYKPTPSSAQSLIGIGHLYMVYSYISSVRTVYYKPTLCKEDRPWAYNTVLYGTIHTSSPTCNVFHQARMEDQEVLGERDTLQSDGGADVTESVHIHREVQQARQITTNMMKWSLSIAL